MRAGMPSSGAAETRGEPGDHGGGSVQHAVGGRRVWTRHLHVWRQHWGHRRH